jgi:hypothetical protein
VSGGLRLEIDQPMDAELHCRCGGVRGRVTEVSPKTVNRVICYCDDCQAFAHHLNRADLMDGHGGTDIVQVAPAALTFVQGQERIAGVRLTPKGLYRWYANCCRTPVGNCLSPAIPFVGIVAQVFESETQKPDALFGRPIGRIFGKHAKGQAPGASTRISLSLMMRAIPMVLGWRLRGWVWPHPFFDPTTRAPFYPMATLSPQEREGLRALCGPRGSEDFHS